MNFRGWWQKCRGEWRLEGWDTFGRHSYPLPGRYRTRARAEAAARAVLRRLERTQPSDASGGQDGIQDQVYVVSPTGVRHRVR